MACHIRVCTVKFSVEAVQLHQLIVVARLGHLALLDHEYKIRVSDCGKAMSYHDAGSSDLRFFERLLYDLFYFNQVFN